MVDGSCVSRDRFNKNGRSTLGFENVNERSLDSLVLTMAVLQHLVTWDK